MRWGIELDQLILVHAVGPAAVDQLCGNVKTDEAGGTGHDLLLGRDGLRVGDVAIVELREMGDIPKRVTLNEAVELAKRFGSEGSGSFVNGVLDRIATELGKP